MDVLDSPSVIVRMVSVDIKRKLEKKKKKSHLTVGDDNGPSDKSPVSMNCETTSFEETEELPLTSLAPHQWAKPIDSRCRGWRSSLVG